jgi:hypothetical protein
MFFSEEKNQKTFMSCANVEIRALAGDVQAEEGIKSFLLLFSKKTSSLSSR